MDRGRNGKPSRSTCNKCRYKKQAEWKRNHPKVRLVNFAKHRAKINNLPFNITADDFEFPEYCPVLNIKLELGKKKLHDASPTLDRIIPELGYVKGNVKVISYKANRIKNNGSLKDLKLVVQYMESKDYTEATCESRESVTTNTSESPEYGFKIESDLVGDYERVPEVIQETMLEIA